MSQKISLLFDAPAEPAAQPFMLNAPANPADPIEPRRQDPFEVRLSGKLLRAQLRGMLPARHR